MSAQLRYRRLFETAQDGILILDALSGKIADVNPYLKSILGYNSSELLGKQLWEIGVFKDIVNSKKAFLKLQTKGYLSYEDLPLQTKTGKIIEVEFVSSVYTVDTQRVIQCNIRDISQRKKTEAAIKARNKELQQLTRSQERLKKAMLNVMEDLEKAKDVIEIEKVKAEAMLSSIGNGLIAINTNRKVMIINKSAERMLGYKMKEVLGKEITCMTLESEDGQIVPPDKRPSYLALTTGKSTYANYFFIRKDKTKLPVAINVTPIKLGSKIIGSLEIFRDTTREQEIDKAKGEFVSLASHQLRTPLGVIKWYLESLENEGSFKKAPQVVKKCFKEIYKSNERVLSLVRDLLSVSRIEQGQINNTPKSTNILKVVRRVVGQMRILASQKRVHLRLIIKNSNVPPIEIDVLQLYEVLENLIGNAIIYTTAPGIIKVTVDITSDRLSVSVSDTGIGISPEDQKNLFTKFFRSERSVVYNPEGAGLGLYLVKSYIEGWGGEIQVQSTEGKGSTFTIRLPVS